MMAMLRQWGNNPANPKKVQISFMAIIGLMEFLNRIDPRTLSSEDREAYDFIRMELTDKQNRVRNRQAYTAIVHAQTPEEKQAAYECNKNTKQMSV